MNCNVFVYIRQTGRLLVYQVLRLLPARNVKKYCNTYPGLFKFDSLYFCQQSCMESSNSFHLKLYSTSVQIFICGFFVFRAITISWLYFFLGRDASRSFITGMFKEEDLSDDVIDLDPNDLIGLDTWLSTYRKKYKEIGIWVFVFLTYFCFVCLYIFFFQVNWLAVIMIHLVKKQITVNWCMKK